MRRFCAAIVLGVLLLTAPVLVNADPPTRVARLSYVDGPVIFAPAGQDDWVNAGINRPIITGDRIWSDANSRGELQLGRAAIRFSDNTSIAVLNLDSNLAQVQLTQGVLNLNIRSVRPDQVYQINTPNLVFSTSQPGDYRLDVNSDGNETIVTVRSGQAEVYGDNTSYIIPAQQTFSFTKTNLGNYQRLVFAANDDFDRWSYERQRMAENTISARYVSPEVVGYEDLDRYGSWTQADVYGNVWIPNNVGSDWAPYREGHWAWISPWGWTWVDHEEWGYAPFHYGRWAYVEGRWGWIPGPINGLSIYAPALVGFLGGINFVFGSDGISWVPLGYNDVYIPPYSVSQQYFSDINTGGTFLRSNQVRKYYNRRGGTMVFSNQNISNAVTAVPRNVFIQSQSVSKARVSVSKDALSKAELRQDPAIAAPQTTSVNSNGTKPTVQAPDQVLSRTVVEKSPKTAAPKQLIDLKGSTPIQNESAPQVVKPTPAPEQKPKPFTVKDILHPGGGKEPDRPRPQPPLAKEPEPSQPITIFDKSKQPERIQQQPIIEERKPEVREPERVIQQSAPVQREVIQQPEIKQIERIQQPPVREERQPEVRQPERVIQQSAPVQREVIQQPPVREERQQPPSNPQDSQSGGKKSDRDKRKDD